MMVALASREGKRPLVIIGLSEGNLARLREGKPAGTDEQVHASLPCDVVICYGATTGELYAQFAPLMGEDTLMTVHDAKEHGNG